MALDVIHDYDQFVFSWSYDLLLCSGFALINFGFTIYQQLLDFVLSSFSNWYQKVCRSLHEGMQNPRCGGGGPFRSFFSSSSVQFIQQQIQLSSSCVLSDISTTSSLIHLHLQLQLLFQHASVPHIHLFGPQQNQSEGKTWGKTGLKFL